MSEWEDHDLEDEYKANLLDPALLWRMFGYGVVYWPRMVTGLVLAGGRSSRMDGNKAFAQLGGRCILEHVLERLEPQADTVLISANEPSERYQRFGRPVLADTEAGARAHRDTLRAFLTAHGVRARLR